MNIQEIHTHIGNKWIKILGISDELKKVLSDFKGNNLIGYVYIDHTAGITLDVFKVFDIQGDEIIYRESPRNKNIRVISRLDGIVKSKEVHILPDEQIEELELKTPEYLSIYERPDLMKFRLDDTFHKFRAEGYPDDVQILLLPTGELKPELVWGRVEQYENGSVSCNLLNQPHQNFGLKINDTLNVSFQSIKEEEYLVYETEPVEKINAESNKVTKNPWYKFW